MKIIFGALYLAIALVFASHFYLNVFSLGLSLVLCSYLIGKGIIFLFMKHSPLSALDVITGFYFLLLSFATFPNTWITAIFLFYISQKGATYVLQGFR